MMTREQILKTYWEVGGVWYGRIGGGATTVQFALRALGQCLENIDPNTKLSQAIADLRQDIIVGCGKKAVVQSEGEKVVQFKRRA